jgi:hypothetical protein
MEFTMPRAKQFVIGFALLAFTSAGSAEAQVNVVQPKNSAQAAANQAQKSAQPGAAGATGVAGQKPQNSSGPAQKPPKPLRNQTQTPSAQPAQPQQSSAKPAAKPAAKTAAPAPTVEPKPPGPRRDPFVGLVGKDNGSSNAPVHLPPGKGGLQVETLMLQGIVRGPNGMIAVVANPSKSVYFLHDGDELFDGKVKKIDMDGVTFHEIGKDAFGKPLERDVTKKLNPSSGEQP